MGGNGVSYILTVFNKTPYLADVIAALAAQTGDFAREFIFVDDGSTDGSAEMIERLTAGWTNVRVIRQQNCGPGTATNTAAVAARFDYLKIVDADDILVPDSGAWLLDALLRHKAVMSYGNAGGYNAGSPVTFPALHALPPSRRIADPVTMLLRNSFICPSVMMVPRQLYLQVGGCAENTIAQDYSLQIKIALLGAFAHVDAVVALLPLVAPGRLSSQVARVLHDVSFHLYETLRDNPELTPAQRSLAVRRATGRALRFRRRNPGESSLLASWLRYLAARLPFGIDPQQVIADSLPDFGVPSQIDGFSPFRGSAAQPREAV